MDFLQLVLGTKKAVEGILNYKNTSKSKGDY
jgi:hypothetical protein